jgi:hypothetical protein
MRIYSSASIAANPNSSSMNFTYVRIDTLRSYELLPDTYQVRLNYMPVTVEVKTHHETILKVGYIEIKYMDPDSWLIKEENPTQQSYP